MFSWKRSGTLPFRPIKSRLASWPPTTVTPGARPTTTLSRVSWVKTVMLCVWSVNRIGLGRRQFFRPCSNCQSKSDKCVQLESDLNDFKPHMNVAWNGFVKISCDFFLLFTKYDRIVIKYAQKLDLYWQSEQGFIDFLYKDLFNSIQLNSSLFV